MADASTMRIGRRSEDRRQNDTEIAILQVQVQNIEDKIGDMKTDLREANISMEKHADSTTTLLKEMQAASLAAHKSTSDKISTLEKWRWMIMGAGVVLGSLGFDTLSKLLK